MKKSSKNGKKSAIVMAVMCAIILSVSLIKNSDIVMVDTAYGADISNRTDEVLSENIINTNEDVTDSDSTETTNRPSTANKPDNGLMSKEEMFVYEPHIDTEAIPEVEDFTEEELLEVIEDPDFSPDSIAITVDDLAHAIETVQAQRYENAKNNDNWKPDVGTSTVEVLETTEKPQNITVKQDVVSNGPNTTNGNSLSTDEVGTNGVVTTNKTTANQGFVTVGVSDAAELVEEKVIPTKTMIRVYDPNGNKTEYVVESDSWSNVPLDGPNGLYVINVYQSINGGSFVHISRSESWKGPQPVEKVVANNVVEKETPKTETASNSSSQVVNVKPDTTTPPTTTVTEEKESTVSETSTAPETVIETVVEPVVESAPEPVEAPVVEEKSSVDSGVTLDDIMSGFGF